MMDEERRNLENGRRAQIDAILSSGREEIDRFLVVTAMENKDAIHGIQDTLKSTVLIKRTLVIMATSAVTAVGIEFVHFIFH